MATRRVTWRLHDRLTERATEVRATASRGATGRGSGLPECDQLALVHREVENRMTPQPAQLARFSLWIDVVGGYLVCPGDELLVGQAVESPQVEIPIVGDVARRHLRLRRLPEGYLLEPLAETRVNDRLLESASLLADGDTIELTGGVRLRFRKPHPLSMTACLDLLTRHRTRPWSDGVILMAESLLLGSLAKDHIVCPNWLHELVLFRRGNELTCRHPESLTIDGAAVSGAGSLTMSSRVVGPEFSFSVEPVDSLADLP